VAAFGLAGLGCSALLPLTVSLGQEQLPAVSAGVAGLVIACYQVGDGVAAFGGGRLQEAGVTLDTLYAGAAVLALAIGVLAVAVTRRPARGPDSPSLPVHTTRRSA
jgi:predicted MFS family arabinose efflux permease